MKLKQKKQKNSFLYLKQILRLYFLIFTTLKKINDKYGHACGDEILKSFAKILKELIRKEDIVAALS